MPEREDGAKSAVTAPESPLRRQLRLEQESHLAEAEDNPAGVLTIQPIPEERSYWK